MVGLQVNGWKIVEGPVDIEQSISEIDNFETRGASAKTQNTATMELIGDVILFGVITQLSFPPDCPMQSAAKQSSIRILILYHPKTALFAMIKWI
jgi:hypothetical protein